jgi:NAD(P)-dependent dehydrogenase (short-subunit alcohol dehydrogenase family)
VTGGSSGIGLAIARNLLNEGALVASCARDPVRLRKAYFDLRDDTRNRLFIAPCDVLDPNAVQNFVDAAARRAQILRSPEEREGIRKPRA